ncbi:hypothetical protein QRX50_22185 [Amycolatopsis carbonis]|uniref:Uncharacterized protein n=1 Tax=Amycolatopsis carbonis TaxID=715471 RepID=A0A9Y2MVV3_9PSEU|nr:hypothetical protein [Amycolatopsis sp. 2-15]WIX83275.1 hypothetical protein QRX50_22185 [Amycolatopsis sp. 2-15]
MKPTAGTAGTAGIGSGLDERISGATVPADSAARLGADEAAVPRVGRSTIAAGRSVAGGAA